VRASAAAYHSPRTCSRVEQVAALARKRQTALVVAQIHRLDEALVAQVVEHD
jgi:hypothetical protein